MIAGDPAYDSTLRRDLLEPGKNRTASGEIARTVVRNTDCAAVVASHETFFVRLPLFAIVRQVLQILAVRRALSERARSVTRQASPAASREAPVMLRGK